LIEEDATDKESIKIRKVKKFIAANSEKCYGANTNALFFLFLLIENALISE